MAYASYNPFHNNAYKDCLIAALINSFTSLFSGFVVFGYLGYMSVTRNVTMGEVVNESKSTLVALAVACLNLHLALSMCRSGTSVHSIPRSSGYPTGCSFLGGHVLHHATDLGPGQLVRST